MNEIPPAYEKPCHDRYISQIKGKSRDVYDISHLIKPNALKAIIEASSKEA